jgi:hypothetical protein
MKRYLLSIYQPDDGRPDQATLDRVMGGLDRLNQEIRGAGGWVFTGGLHGAEAATVVRARDGEISMTDGPFAEGKEHVGGFWVVKAPDLDVALGWAAKAAEVTTLPIEVRPFQGTIEE